MRMSTQTLSAEQRQLSNINYNRIAIYQLITHVVAVIYIFIPIYDCHFAWALCSEVAYRTCH